MIDKEASIVETGRVICRRYLLRRVIKQGPFCTVYQGLDQVLQRPVAVKAVPPSQVSVYRTALRMTAQFSHPHIVGLYDIVGEGDQLYVVQEYVEGEDFTALLQRQLSPLEVIELGCQLCQALVYAASGTRRVCHGDLTPSAILRDRQGFLRVNNFALPSDVAYFSAWSVVGAAGIVLSDQELPWGQASEGRLDDDTRAAGLLLYQLLAGRSAGATSVEPPPDGRLRFLRTAPPELCDLIARAVMRDHPQHINRPEALYMELKALEESLEAAVPVSVAVATPAVEEGAVARPFTPAPLLPETEGQPLPSLPSGEGGRRLSSFASATPSASAGLHPGSALELSPASPTLADSSLTVPPAQPQPPLYPYAGLPPSA
ncbi:MAG: protein kinase, partial [Thermogemmatispora sp.]|uniref:protein kinase domain-containing protein n=1 Tax=Thermogemmatispora sp. TaxID=1968838 RepID=UPI001DF143D9